MAPSIFSSVGIRSVTLSAYISWDSKSGGSHILKSLIRFLPFMTFIIGCVIALIIANADKRLDEDHAQASLERQALFAEIQFQDRITMFRQLLYTGYGLMAHDPEMTLDEWQHFVGALKLGASYPGLERFSIVKYVKESDIRDFVGRLEKQVPGFAIIPPGNRPDYMIMTRGLNLGNVDNLIGYDIGSNQSRRLTAELSRDSGDATLSPPVPIIAGQKEQDGPLSYIYYLPFYKGGILPQTLESRRDLILGWIGVSFSIEGLLIDILNKYRNLDIEVHDIASNGKETLIFDSDIVNGYDANIGRNPAFKHTSTLSFGGRQWQMTVATTPDLEQQMVSNGPLKILIIGGFAALMMGIVVELLLRGRQRAYALAQAMTTAHRKSEQRYRGLVNAQRDMVVRLTSTGTLTFINDNVVKILEKSFEKIVDTNWYRYFTDDDVNAAAQAVNSVASGEHDRFLIKNRVVTAQGQRWYAWDGCSIHGDDGAVLEIQATGRDITDLMNHEAQLQSALLAAEQANIKLLASNIQMLTTLSNIIALRDSDTFHHNLRVMIYSYYMAVDMNQSVDAIRNLLKGALLHDIGKIGISDNILLKQGKLTPDEFETIKTHVTIGRDFVRDAVWLERVPIRLHSRSF